MSFADKNLGTGYHGPCRNCGVIVAFASRDPTRCSPCQNDAVDPVRRPACSLYGCRAVPRLASGLQQQTRTLPRQCVRASRVWSAAHGVHAFCLVSVCVVTRSEILVSSQGTQMATAATARSSVGGSIMPGPAAMRARRGWRRASVSLHQVGSPDFMPHTCIAPLDTLSG